MRVWRNWQFPSERRLWRMKRGYGKAQRSKFIGAPSRNEFWAPQEASGFTVDEDGEGLQHFPKNFYTFPNVINAFIEPKEKPCVSLFFLII